MITRVLRLLAPLISLACGNGTQARSTAATTRHSARPDDHGLRGPFLWEVQGAAGPSYLFGTIHAGFHADQELPAWVWDKLDGAETFIMELDPTTIPIAELARMSQLPEGKSLDLMLGAEDWTALTTLVDAAPDSLKRLQPWAVYLLIAQKLYPTPVPLDLALRTRALAKGKNLVYLEEWKLQAAILADMELDDLRELLDPRGKGQTQLAGLVAAYRDGDFEKLTAIGLDSEEIAKNPKRHARLLDDRNRDWIGKLVPHLERGRSFVAVGALHFPGEQGLIELLRAKGFVLTRVVRP